MSLRLDLRPAPIMPLRVWLRTIGLLVMVGVVLMLAIGASRSAGVVWRFDTALSDLRFRIAPRAASGDVVLIDIDARSLAEIGVWPWPRRLHGELVQAAARTGAAQLAFDVDFSSASRPDDDDAFAEALANAGMETFLAVFVQPETAGSNELRPSVPIAPLLDASWPASINVPTDPDGQVRRFPRSVTIDGEQVASMPTVVAARDATDGEFGIDHAIAVDTIPRVSYVDLLRGRVSSEALRGKSLIVGASAIELHDLFRVPAFGVVSGSTVIALATETLVQNRAIATRTVPIALLLALVGIGGVIVLRASMKRSLLVLLAIAACIEATAAWLYVEHAVMARTSEMQLALAGLMLWSLGREFGMRRLLLWAARTRSRNTLKLLERIVDDGFDAVVILDGDGRIARANEAARRLLGLPGGQDLGQAEGFPPALLASVGESLSKLERGQADLHRLRGMDTIRSGASELVVEYSVVSFWMDEEGARTRRSRYVAVMLHDVTDRETAQERLRHAALHDSLTRLPNRRAMEAELARLLSRETAVTLLAFDLDRFKGVNDALGHATGDAVLVETARRVAAALPQAATLFRIGGDEFVVLLRSGDADQGHEVAEHLVREIVRPFTVRGHRVSVGASVGLASNMDGCRDPSALRRRADVALYRAKRSSTERVVAFDMSMETIRLERLALEKDLKQAIEGEEFEVAYQPQVRLADGTWTGAEALVRWRHPAGGFVSPAEFVPVAEEMGLIHELGAQVLRIACRDAQGWPVPVKVAVNVSPLQLVAGDVVAAVRDALAASSLDPKRLELEITESAFVGENDRLARTFEELLALGVTFALDDFGTGYSSLGYLHRFPISKIKIDRSFVTDIPASRHSMAVLRAVMALADGMAIRTIAEGIETPDQSRLLRELGCQEGQGYLFSKPIAAEAVIDLLRRQQAEGDPNGGAVQRIAVA